MRDGKKRMVWIGCGGVAFHAVSLVRVEMEVAGGPWTVMCVDPDEYEGKNGTRQPWTEGEEGRKKADLLAGALADMADVRCFGGTGQEWLRECRLGRAEEGWEGEVDVMVIAPDNHKCRRECLEKGWRMLKRSGRVVVAGNEMDWGGAWAVNPWELGGIEWVQEVHPEVWAEEEEREEGPGCAEMQAQSARGNQFTGLCLARCLRVELEGSGWYYEASWKKDDHSETYYTWF